MKPCNSHTPHRMSLDIVVWEQAARGMKIVDALKMMKISATAEQDATKILDVLVIRIVPRTHDAISTQHLHARANVKDETRVN